MPIWVIILTTSLGSTALFSFLQFLITRNDQKRGQMASIVKRLDKLEKDSIRTQLLVLMNDYPENKQQIIMLAEYYFCSLKSNWYLTGIFENFLKKNGIPSPVWFRGGYHHEAEK